MNLSSPPNLMGAKGLDLNNDGGMLELRGNYAFAGIPDDAAIHRHGHEPQPGKSFLPINARQMKVLKNNPRILYTCFISDNGNPALFINTFRTLNPKNNDFGKFVVSQGIRITALRKGEFDPDPYERDINKAKKMNIDNEGKIKKAKDALAKAAAQANTFNYYNIFEFTVRK